MESSEIQKRIINLGKVLVEELDLDPGFDTLARWMVYYVAEQMTVAENATGDEKVEAEKNCFETILKLWEHRSSLPNGRRPLESFEPIFHALERLDPENRTPYFYSSPDSQSSNLDDPNDSSNEVHQWLDIAQGIDQSARVWLECVFQQAALCKVDENTLKWIENAAGLPGSDPISVILHLIDFDPESEQEEVPKQKQQARQEKLASRIKQLDAFTEFNQTLRTTFLTELEGITQSDPSENVIDTDEE